MRRKLRGRRSRTDLRVPPYQPAGGIFYRFRLANARTISTPNHPITDTN